MSSDSGSEEAIQRWEKDRSSRGIRTPGWYGDVAIIYRHQKVPAGEPQQTLHMTFFVRTPHQTEVLLEQATALESQKLLRQLTLAPAKHLQLLTQP